MLPARTQLLPSFRSAPLLLLSPLITLSRPLEPPRATPDTAMVPLQWWVTPASCTWLRIHRERWQHIGCCTFPWAITSHFNDVFSQVNHSNILQNYTTLQAPTFQALAVFYMCFLAHLSAAIFILFNLTHLWVSPSTTPALCLANALRNLPNFAFVPRTPNQALPCCKNSPAFSSQPAHPRASADLRTPTKASRSCRTCKRVEDRLASWPKLQPARTLPGKEEQHWASLSPRWSRVSPAMCLPARSAGTQDLTRWLLLDMIPHHVFLRKTMAEARREAAAGLHTLPVPQVRFSTFSIPI